MVEGESVRGGKGHGGGVNEELCEVRLVLLEVQPVEARLGIAQNVNDLREEGVSGATCGLTFSENVPDVLPFSGACSAVTRDSVDTSVSTLFCESPVGQIILTEHLDMDS